MWKNFGIMLLGAFAFFIFWVFYWNPGNKEEVAYQEQPMRHCVKYAKKLPKQVIMPTTQEVREQCEPDKIVEEKTTVIINNVVAVPTAAPVREYEPVEVEGYGQVPSANGYVYVDKNWCPVNNGQVYVAGSRRGVGGNHYGNRAISYNRVANVGYQHFARQSYGMNQRGFGRMHHR